MGIAYEEGQVAQPLSINGRSIVILYGSETGNSEEIALELGKMSERLHFRTVVDEMDSFKLTDLLRFSMAIFVTSTTGQGDMPKNTTKFWRNLRREKLNNTNCLGNLNFSIFGLGNSSYQKFNWAARKLRVRLLQLGASEFFKAGEGDERHNDGIDSIYLPWQQELRASLLTNYPLPDSVTPIPDDIQLPPRYTLRLATSIRPGGETEEGDKQDILGNQPEESTDNTRGLPPADMISIPSTYLATLSENVRATPQGHWQDVRELALEVRFPLNLIPRYAAGSCVTVYPKNYPEDVQSLIELMGWQDVADKPLTGHEPESAEHDHAGETRPRGLYLKENGTSTTLRDLLTHNLDITSVPRRHFIKELVFFTKDPREKERLKELTSPGNEQDLYDYTSRPRRTIIEMLRDFPCVRIPFNWALNLIPTIRGRDFSICNGGASLEGKGGELTLHVEVLAALVEFQTIIRKPRQGLCSRYLKHLLPGTTLRVGIKPADKFLSPENSQHKRPLIAIATGTGIAPIHALIEDRARFSRTGPVFLFYGCRSKDADFYFGNDWARHPNVRVVPAFSRDPFDLADVISAEPNCLKSAGGLGLPEPTYDYDVNKNYVQHHIRKHAKEVGELMRQHPIVCICGNAGKMPASVRAALCDALVLSNVVVTREEAEKFMADPKNLSMWQEVW
ncbi:hypothetical protein B0H67DRAFT_488069 [Lasiosphaeris hirsuta]|uniref:Uncharacterized protein n=1 Tax=Lasiosphaeris hirsuta TaxID=260670 RepID=A0AA40AFM9_9PEZI|nr:hypothetical protein B0H67DRAFT_488069 [Lasiosphaeris hirsuta]